MTEKLTIGVGADLSGVDDAVGKTKQKITEAHTELNKLGDSSGKPSIADYPSATGLLDGLSGSDKQKAYSEITDLSKHIRGEFKDVFGVELTDHHVSSLSKAFSELKRSKSSRWSYLDHYTSVSDFLGDDQEEMMGSKKAGGEYRKRVLSEMARRSSIHTPIPEQDNNDEDPRHPRRGWFQSAAAQAGSVGANAVAGGGGSVLAGGAGAIGRSMLTNPWTAIPGLAMMVGGAVIAKNLPQAQEEATQVADLRSILGATVTDFDGLRDTLRIGAERMKLTYGETGKLAQEFAKLSYETDGIKIANELRTAVGMARSYGEDPALMTRLFGTLRRTEATESPEDDRRLSFSLAEAIDRSGLASAGDISKAVEQFSIQTARSSLNAPNVPGFLSMLSSIAGENIPGLRAGDAAGMLMSADASFRGGGRVGEASENFRLAAYQKSFGEEFSGLMQPFLNEQGLFGTFSGMSKRVMGSLSPDQQTQLQGMMGKEDGNTPLIDIYMREVNQQYGDNGWLKNLALSSDLGISSMDASVLSQYAQKSGGLGGLHQRVTSVLGDEKFNPRSLASFAQIASGDQDELDLLSEKLRTGDGYSKISKQESADLLRAKKGGIETHRDELFRLVAGHTSKDQGQDIRDMSANMENLFTSISGKAIPLLEGIKAGIYKIAGIDEEELDSEEFHRLPLQERQRISKNATEQYLKDRSDNGVENAMDLVYRNAPADAKGMFDGDEINYKKSMRMYDIYKKIPADSKGMFDGNGPSRIEPLDIRVSSDPFVLQDTNGRPRSVTTPKTRVSQPAIAR